MDYLEGAEIPTGQLSTDSKNLVREILFATPMMAKQVKVYFLCDGSTGIHYAAGECYRGGRFDLTVEKTSFAILNFGATHSQESAASSDWSDPQRFGTNGFHQGSSRGVSPMWVQIDFP